MEDMNYSEDFRIIALAGNARSKSIQALSAARKKDFENADRLLEEARQEMKDVHSVQHKLLSSGYLNSEREVNILTVHGQDHLSMAIVTYDLVTELVELLRQKEETQA